MFLIGQRPVGPIRMEQGTSQPRQPADFAYQHCRLLMHRDNQLDQ